MKKKKRGKNNPEDTLPEESTGEAAETQDDAPEVLEAAEPTHEQLYNEAQDRYMRAMAEFENFRKRSIKEKAAQYDDGLRAAAEKLLPIIDNFERAMAASAATHADDTFYQGITLIARQFTQFLDDLGVEAIPANPGDEFDPNCHNAVAHEENADFGANQIAAELQKGYRHKDKVLRYSMVKVAN